MQSAVADPWLALTAIAHQKYSHTATAIITEFDGINGLVFLFSSVVSFLRLRYLCTIDLNRRFYLGLLVEWPHGY